MDKAPKGIQAIIDANPGMIVDFTDETRVNGFKLNNDLIIEASQHLVNVELSAAKYCLYSAQSAFEYGDKERSRDYMALYHLHIKLAYALNELWNQPIDVYSIVNAISA